MSCGPLRRTERATAGAGPSRLGEDEPMLQANDGGDDRKDFNGRAWPKITKENAAEHEPPNLRQYNTTRRGTDSPPYCWYVQISGEATWDQDSRSYRKMKQRWDGWVGANEKRVEQRRASEQQRATHNRGNAEREANEARVAQERLSSLPPDLARQAEFLDARAADMAASLLSAVASDGRVALCSMEVSVERRLHEQMHLCPQLRKPSFFADEEWRELICSETGPRCSMTHFSLALRDGSKRHYCDGRCAAPAARLPDRPPIGALLREGTVVGEVVSSLQDDPTFVAWNGPKLDWPGYTITPDGFTTADALAFDRRWHRTALQWDDSRAGNASVFVQLRDQRQDFGLQWAHQERVLSQAEMDSRLPPWLLIRRVLQILESKLNLTASGSGGDPSSTLPQASPPSPTRVCIPPTQPS